MRKSCTCYVLLVLCLRAAVAQLFGTQTHYDLNQRRQLTPTQQGHILSDIQQHQHRFNLRQNNQQGFPQQEFGQRILKDNYNQFVGQPSQATFLQNPQILTNPIHALQPQIFSTQQTLIPTNQPVQVSSSSFLPNVHASTNPILNGQTNGQHHTQTVFTPNFKQQEPTINPINQISAHQHLFQVTSNPLFNVDQSQPLDPEKQKERLKELQEKQAIIEKHNQFVERQYEKALKKAQSDHLDFIKDQQEQKKKLYQKIYKDPGNIPRYRLNNPRYIYPEETNLFNLAVQKYYEEHPTTTTTTTTTTQAPTTINTETRSAKTSEIFQASPTNSEKSFLPTAPSKIKTIQSLDDLKDLKSQYQSQQIDKDDLIAQLKLAIGENPENERNITSREISLPNGQKVEIIRTNDPKSTPLSEFTLPNGQKVEVIRTTDPKLFGAGQTDPKLDELVKQQLNLPDGQKYEIITDPKALQAKSQIKIEPTTDLDKLVQAKLNLPDGDKYEIIQTTNPKALQAKLQTKIEPTTDLDKLVQAKLNLPDGDKYEIIQTTNPKALQAKSQIKIEPTTDLDKLVQAKLNLPDGDKYEIIQTTDPKSIPKDLQFAASTTTGKPPTEIFQELTSGVVPPGANFQILRHDNGGLEQITGLPSSLPDQKKVTFVLLEEQNDGSFKVQGVKGNGGKEKDAVDVDSILKRIKDGEIKLPPPSKKNQIEISKDDFDPEKNDFTTEIAPVSSTISSTSTKLIPTSPTSHFIPSVTVTPNSFASEIGNTPISKTSVTPNSFASEIVNTPILKTSVGNQFVTETPFPINNKVTSTTIRPSVSSYETATSLNFNHSNDLQKQASTISHSSQNSLFGGVSHYQTTPNFPSSTITIFKSDAYAPTSSPPTSKPTSSEQKPTLLEQKPTFPEKNPIFPEQNPKSPEQNPTFSEQNPTFPELKHTFPELKPTFPEQKPTFPDQKSEPELPDLLKKNGLFAMAKFLRQSGLDTILNETGPYTIFAPNDKAFKTLLVQLGGPDKAEEKFRDNPRLLSGLLLHHVIPGSFKIGSLQDEMTGVSLAGTQLRVNQYNMHDVEWNDVKITTINGAKVLEDKRDIEIPQGFAHAIDRVMFPLPVGDIVQTLQSDRERRFTSFLRALFNSGLAEMLQGTKMFTVFAPTDRAFATLSSDDLSKMLNDKTLARELVMRHIISGTVFTNGIRYYQIKDSLEPTKPITLSKTGGKVKVNNDLIATQNIPTTNGVIHAVDVLL